MNKKSIKPFLLGLSISLLILISALGGALADRLFVIKPLNALSDNIARYVPTFSSENDTSRNVTTQILKEESVVIDASKKAANSVVTVAIKKQQRVGGQLFLDPFGGFGFPGFRQEQGRVEEIQRDIGSGFVVDENQGLIVTNKHVVSDPDAEYLVIDKDDKEYKVQNIYRDPANDIAIVKINEKLPALELGDSDNLQVGQFVIAIGTALGEFRHTVTTGVISGLGRGITAGDQFGFFAEELSNVIQTDAAINPGNSGGPLLNSAGQVIGVNVAVAGGGAENIGFALPINVIKESLDNFETTGKFERPFLGVSYQMIPKRTAIMNDMPQGAYIMEVVAGSSAARAGLQADDVITKFDGNDLTDDKNSLAKLINSKKVGDKVKIEYWRNGEKKEVEVVLRERG